VLNTLAEHRQGRREAAPARPGSSWMPVSGDHLCTAERFDRLTELKYVSNMYLTIAAGSDISGGQIYPATPPAASRRLAAEPLDSTGMPRSRHGNSTHRHETKQ
jgi:hypothetical protein